MLKQISPPKPLGTATVTLSLPLPVMEKWNYRRKDSQYYTLTIST